MNTKRTIATMAALGGFTAAIALLSGMPLAKADELSDLRANQQLLQERIDQLSQAPGLPTNPYGVATPNAAMGQPSLAGSFPRSFLIPGTDTSIRVGGEIREIVSYWFNGANPNASPQSGTIGITGQVEAVPLNISSKLAALGAGAAEARSNGVFNQTPYQSKMNIETRTPTAWGEARTFLEFDFSGSNAFVPGGSNPVNVSDSIVPRLRYAYGTLGGVLAGQANSNFADPDANGEVIDFGGNAGEPGVVRVPQVRYTVPLQPWGFLGALSVSAETGQTTMGVAGGNFISSDLGASATSVTAATAVTCTASVAGVVPTCTVPLTGNIPVVNNPTKATAPNLTAAWYIPQPWGHVDFSAVVLPGLEVNDGEFVNKDYIGYGLHTGFDVKPGWFGWSKDDIIFHAVYGNGIGPYLNASTNFSLISNYPTTGAPGSAVAASAVHVQSTYEYGGEVGYQHWWADNLRSNINAGVNFHDINSKIAGCLVGAAPGAGAAALGSGACGYNKEIVTAHANLIWNPVPFVDVGLEYTYGHRVVLSNVSGDENVLQGKFGVKF